MVQGGVVVFGERQPACPLRAGTVCVLLTKHEKI